MTTPGIGPGEHCVEAAFQPLQGSKLLGSSVEDLVPEHRDEWP